jgi:hypothetical protein
MRAWIERLLDGDNVLTRALDALAGPDALYDEFDQCRECTKCIGHEPGCSQA